MAFTRKGFSQVVGNGFAGFGFAPEGPTVYEFPLEMFVPGSDLTPINENIDKIVYALTKWEPKIKKKGVYYPAEKVTVQGKDYQEALANMNNLFLENLWGDGLPIFPATEERVKWILTGTDLPLDTVVGTGKILPRGGIATVEGVAVALAEAGGRPEYLPVLIAAVEAFVKPEFVQQSLQATTSSTFPVVIVNGPVAKQIRLGSGYGLLGPDPLHPAGGSIGRALRLIQMNLGGAIPGIGTMAIYGANRFTNIVFAEDEEGLPKGWEPLNVTYWGYPRGTNTVGLFGANSSINVGGGGQTLTKEGVQSVLDRFVGVMSAPNSNYYSGGSFDNGAPGLVFMARGTAQSVATFGWTKGKLQRYLWENSRNLKTGVLTPVTARPENIMIVVAGGEQSGHSFYMGVGLGPQKHTSAGIKLPAKAKWDALLKQAETDLGPIPAQ